MSSTASFFHAMAPVLTANVLTVTLVYSCAKIAQKERSGEEQGRGTWLWLIVLVNLFMLYGLYCWGVYPFKNGSPAALHTSREPTMRVIPHHPN